MIESDRQQVFAVTEAELSAIQSSDTEKYFSLLSDDATLSPPNAASKTGAELRRWLSEFLEQVAIERAKLVHGETWIRDDLACHEYTCRWTATRKSGGTPTAMAFKGMHVLRREPGGQWRIVRNIWNVDPV